MTLKYTLDKGVHSVHALQYHFIQVVRYRKRVFADEKIIDFLKQKVRALSMSFEVDVPHFECNNDHCHMIFNTKPTLELPRFINAVKTITSREIQRSFPEVTTKLWKGLFRSRLYFLATTGQVTLAVLNYYVEAQRNAQL